jgi:peptidoglycan/LPS O-acetylase OafA/YrhL
MKKTVFAVVISLLLLTTTVVLILNSGPIKWEEGLEYFILLVLVAFGLYVAYRRITSAKRGQPAEDEFSKKVLQKASSLSFYISIYMWLVIMYQADKLEKPSGVMFGWGILGMAIIFVLSWVYYNFRGIRE